MVGTSNLGSWNSHWHNVSLNQPMDISYTKHLGVECGVLNLTQHGTGQNEVPKKVERNKINMKNSSIRGGPTGLTFHKCAFFLIWCLFSDMPGVFYGSPQTWKFRKKKHKIDVGVSMRACLKLSRKIYVDPKFWCLVHTFMIPSGNLT